MLKLLTCCGQTEESNDRAPDENTDCRRWKCWEILLCTSLRQWTVQQDVQDDSGSFLSCRHWKQDLDNKAMLPNGDPIPCILLANKCDLAQRVVSADSINKFSKANGFVTWMETSVKENKNVGEAMRRLVQEILSTRSSLDSFQPGPQDSVNPQLDSEGSSSRGVGCC
ncbi:ras-related protein Rab-7L1 isoform X2 [Lates calcarifer]|uniref:Ras-related protein Rab-7L1 isoform X2 n=1 Tax=Lates calcarifer TaxID=8187 RepID=A0AAJ8DQ66_LATCA|nr:ras-related protein Rab-7L1 isoform X2 [Lates calcarifer]